MTEFGVLQQGQRRRAERVARARRERRRRRIGATVATLVLGLVLTLVLMASRTSDPETPAQAAAPAHAATVARQPPNGAYGVMPAAVQVGARFRTGLRSGLLFDLRSGRVLWQLEPTRVLPIASLTKMMTALVVAAHARPQERVTITREALHYSGSGVGLLPLGKRVSLVSLLYGLLLPSGNDAAIALAQRVAGTQTQFVDMMNARAHAMGLGCTRFSSVSGILDRGNHSCARDLAVMAHAVLAQPLLARIVASRSAALPFPIRGGKLYLYNNNPLMFLRYPGIDGVKTGYTVAAGSCLVASARRGRRWYGVVLLHSANTAGQAQRLLDLAFSTR